MIGNKRIIGVCLTRVQSIAATEYLSRLHMYAMKRGYKIIVFNSPVDFFQNDSNDRGSETVYRLMNYDVLDAVVIYSECFRNKAVYERIIDEAKAHDVPVILLKEKLEGCACIFNDYEDAFKSVMDHVIKRHGVTDTFFIAGNKENDLASEYRIKYYKEVLEENGLPFSEEQLDYGNYWDVPTIMVIQRLLERRRTPPRAIFCANDYMAIAVCDELEKKGYRVPEDVIVTGFDGVPEAEFRQPQLTTCTEDFESLAEQTIGLIEKILDGEDVPQVTLNKYNTRFTESCGCPCCGMEPRAEVQRQYSMVHDVLSHDEFVYGWLSNTLEVKDINDFLSRLPKLAVALGYVCLNDDLISCITEDKQEDREFPYTDSLDIIESEFTPKTLSIKSFPRRDIIPDIAGWAEDPRDTICIVSAINSGEDIYGYYAVRTDNIITEAHRINRTMNALNVAFNSIVGFYKQRLMLLGLKNAALIDQLTGLANLKGTTRWFEKFSSDPKNHERPITISIYGLPKYKFIYENYGIMEIEESIRFVADTLKKSVVGNAFIGHVADDEFLVINWYDSADEIADTINSTTAKFFEEIGKFNADANKGYHLEVNAGCEDLFPGWNGTLESFSKLASNAMYLNRLNYSADTSVNRAKIPVEIYKSFELLIEKNLFDYHFQPIVSVKTGNIIAYEALMRPDKSVNMNPGEVIQTAIEYDRLDDVERATMYNVMKIFSERFPSFKGRKVFVNSIPGHFMHGREYDDFIQRYAEYLGDMVVEITEGSSVTDDELKMIRKNDNSKLPIAIDDYGSGHSNIVNLLRYSPQLIKIDRFLISGIQNDTNKQLFFRSTVEFARLNDIKVLAEGVETAEELKCVIELGADLVQGFYTGRPSPELLDEIDADIKELMMSLTATA